MEQYKEIREQIIEEWLKRLRDVEPGTKESNDILNDYEQFCSVDCVSYIGNKGPDSNQNRIPQSASELEMAKLGLELEKVKVQKYTMWINPLAEIIKTFGAAAIKTVGGAALIYAILKVEDDKVISGVVGRLIGSVIDLR